MAVFDEPVRGAEVDALTRLVEHPGFEAGCAPERLYHARDDAAVEVAEATAELLQAGALGKQNGNEHG